MKAYKVIEIGNLPRGHQINEYPNGTTISPQWTYVIAKWKDTRLASLNSGFKIADLNQHCSNWLSKIHNWKFEQYEYTPDKLTTTTKLVNSIHGFDDNAPHEQIEHLRKQNEMLNKQIKDLLINAHDNE